jgi:hypothetical protein
LDVYLSIAWTDPIRGDVVYAMALLPVFAGPTTGAIPPRATLHLVKSDSTHPRGVLS